jgi:hypothetical protein
MVGNAGMGRADWLNGMLGAETVGQESDRELTSYPSSPSPSLPLLSSPLSPLPSLLSPPLIIQLAGIASKQAECGEVRGTLEGSTSLLHNTTFPAPVVVGLLIADSFSKKIIIIKFLKIKKLKKWG